jgi:hypothetical protein
MVIINLNSSLLYLVGRVAHNTSPYFTSKSFTPVCFVQRYIVWESFHMQHVPTLTLTLSLITLIQYNDITLIGRGFSSWWPCF